MKGLFEEIVSMSAELASVDEADIQLSRGRIKRWTSIATFWETKPQLFEDVFYNAMKHIATGRYPSGSSSMKELCELVETALTSEKDALNGWRKMPDFNDGMNKMRGYFEMYQGCQCIYEFMRNRFNLRIFYREEIGKEIDILSCTVKGFKRAQYIAKIRNDCDCFGQALRLLVPGADQWSLSQWTSQKNIFDAIKNEYGIDYEKGPEQFEHLMEMMIKKLSGKPYQRELFQIKDIPDAMATVIWPQDMVKELSKQLILISQTRPHYVTVDDVKDSWAYGKLSEDRTHLSDKVKGHLLNFGLGTHPYLLRKGNG